MVISKGPESSPRALSSRRHPCSHRPPILPAYDYIAAAAASVATGIEFLLAAKLVPVSPAIAIAIATKTGVS